MLLWSDPGVVHNFFKRAVDGYLNTPDFSTVGITYEAIYIYTRAPSRILNRSAAQTQVKAGVKPELGRSVNIITGAFVFRRLKTRPRKVPAKRPLRPSNSDPAAD